MHHIHDGRRLWKKFGFIWRMSINNSFSDRAFAPTRTVYVERGQFFWHLQNGLKFCMWVSMPTPTWNPKIDRISIQRARCVTSGQRFRCFDRKNYRKFIKWQEATKLVMHPSHDGTRLWKKIGFIWRILKNTSFSERAFAPTRTVYGEEGQFFDIFRMTWNFACELVCPLSYGIQKLIVFQYEEHVASRSAF